jgi:TolB-like protein
MKSLLPEKVIHYILLFLFFIAIPLFGGTPRWYNAYQEGLNAVQAGNWQRGVSLFQEALQVKNEDSNKMRAFGAIFIEYYAHRELGICYYELGNIEKAREELNISINQSSSRRAKMYLGKIASGNYPQSQSETSPEKTEPVIAPMEEISPTREIASTEIVGDRMSVAVLPFDSKGLGSELGSIDLLDKLITGFVNINRFKVIERALLEKILEEQKLGMSGVLDASTAAEIGKGIGVDAVIVGSVTRANNALSIDARLIDTETAAIITAKDAYSDRISLQNVSQMIGVLAEKIKTEVPILNGYVISVSGTKVTMDIGRSNGLKKGMKCHVYREGAPIVHPVTGKVIAREIDEICEVLVSEVFDAYSNGDIIQTKNGNPKVQDKVVTK